MLSVPRGTNLKQQPTRAEKAPLTMLPVIVGKVEKLQ